MRIGLLDSRSLFLGLVTLSLGASVAACSGDDTNIGTSPPAADSGVDATSDAGPHVDAAPDASPTADAGSDATGSGGDDGGDIHASDAGDRGASDAGPLGTLLVPGDAGLIGFTSDDYVVYGQGGALAAIPVGGGAPVTIAESGSVASITGSVVVGVGPAAADDAGACSMVRPLFTWSATHGTSAIAEAFIEPSTYSPSPDGSLLAYITTTPDCTGHTLTVTRSDGSGGTTVLPLTPPCYPSFAFGRNNALLVTSHCTAAGTADVFLDGSGTHSISLPTFRAQIDSSGAWLWVDLAGGGGELLRTADGSVALTEPTSLGAMFAGPEDLLLKLSDGSVTRIALSDLTTSVSILPAGTDDFGAISPDGNAVVYAEGTVDDAGSEPDGWHVLTIGASGAGVPLPMSTGANNYTFTTDSTHLLWTNPLVQGVPTYSEAVGGGPVTTLGDYVTSFGPVRGATVYLMSQVRSGPDTGPNVASLVDLTGATPSKVLSSSAQALAVGPDGLFVAYQCVSPAGIYVLSTL